MYIILFTSPHSLLSRHTPSRSASPESADFRTRPDQTALRASLTHSPSLSELLQERHNYLESSAPRPPWSVLNTAARVAFQTQVGPGHASAQNPPVALQVAGIKTKVLTESSRFLLGRYPPSSYALVPDPGPLAAYEHVTQALG